MGIVYLSTKFELDRFTNNIVLLLDRNIASLCGKIVEAIIMNFLEN